MKVGWLCATLGLLALLPGPDVTAQAPADVASLIAAARQALGGDAALGAVSSFSISGSFLRSVGPGSPTVFFESSCILPDKFVRVGRRSLSSPVGGTFDITDYDGFNGDDAIRTTVAPNAPFPLRLPSPPGPVVDPATVRERQLQAMRQIFLDTVVPLFIVLPPHYGLEPTAGGKATVGKVQADVINMKRAGGTAWSLLLDETTHLPVQLRWRAKPIVTFSTSQIVSSRGGPPVAPPVLPSGDPTAGLAEVEWVMTIRDYQVVDGLNWPRRTTTSFGGKDWEDVRISRYRINPKVDPKLFEPRK